MRILDLSAGEILFFSNRIPDMTSIEKKDFAGGSTPKEDIEQGQSQLRTSHDAQALTLLGYKPQLHRNRSMFTLLFQSLAIAAVRAPVSHNKVLNSAHG